MQAAEWSPYWWIVGKDSLVTYDMAFHSVLNAAIVRRADGTPGELVFKLAKGAVRARRITPSDRRAEHPSERCRPGGQP
ncbi:MAG: hypothetical protein ACRENJ_05385 [Candidatus Eiseniibacteriota bacterium]